MLAFDHVTYHYPERPLPALDSVSFSVALGRRVVLLGANGSGKSTLARLANGLLLADKGEVLVDGLSTAHRETIRDLRTRVGVVVQDPDSQIVSTTVLDEVAFGPENLGLGRADIANRVEGALKLTGLEGFEQRDPNTLSGGEKQRLALAGVLAMNPHYLVLDEPTSMLDAAGRVEVLAVLRRLHSLGHGILHITHDIEDAVEANEVLVLAEGRLEFAGTPEQLFNSEIMLRGLGLTPTPMLALATHLAHGGVSLPPKRTSPNALTKAVLAWEKGKAAP